MDKKYIAASSQERKDIIVSMDAFSNETKEKINDLHLKIAKTDDVPLVIKAVLSAWELIKLKCKAIFTKIKIPLEVKDAQIKLIESISKDIEDINKNNRNLDPDYAQKLANLLVSLLNDISQTPGKTESPTENAAPEQGKVLPNLAELTNIKKLSEEAAPALAAPALAAAAPALAAAAPALAAPALAVAAGGGKKGDGDISHKHSDRKYINQISENRNKIFKKELEIINSIRSFHRSHTIRKRDKINSILGFKKSKNNRNRNHRNTKRHQHRHNKHKNKSAKHIKK